jgi:isoquinoline 1-oxidoreductase subunit alpha
LAGKLERCTTIGVTVPVQFTVNQKIVEVDAAPDTPLLWVLRDNLQLNGTKFGCGVAECGACTVHLNGEAVRACVVPVGALEGAVITTIEGLALAPDKLHALQQAWITYQVPQCGYCQSGMLMAASSLLSKIPNPSDADIDNAMTNICRCGTYPRIRQAIMSVVGMPSIEKVGDA